MNVCSFGVAPVVALIDGRAGEVNPKTVPSMKCPIDMAKTDKICSFLSRLKQMQEHSSRIFSIKNLLFEKLPTYL